MNTPPQATLIIAIFTAIVGSIMVLRNIDSILEGIKRLIAAHTEYWRVRAEREKQQLEESRIRAAFWVRAIQMGIAEEKLLELNQRIRSQHENQNNSSHDRDFDARHKPEY